jgi:hypothetical protein
MVAHVFDSEKARKAPAHISDEGQLPEATLAACGFGVCGPVTGPWMAALLLSFWGEEIRERRRRVRQASVEKGVGQKEIAELVMHLGGRLRKNRKEEQPQRERHRRDGGYGRSRSKPADGREAPVEVAQKSHA